MIKCEFNSDEGILMVEFAGEITVEELTAK